MTSDVQVHDHTHTHGHDHNRNAELQARVNRLIDAAERHGITTRADIDQRLERFVTVNTPLNGARIVVRAWLDAGFKQRLLADATSAITELGYSLGHQTHMRLHAVANTPEVHNLVVCTLCSCYPMALLGAPPAWYKSVAYRSQAVRDPRGVLRQFGVDLPAATEIHVWDSTANARYLVIPQRPAATEGLDEEALLAWVPRDCLIGTALPAAPRAAQA